MTEIALTGPAWLTPADLRSQETPSKLQASNRRKNHHKSHVVVRGGICVNCGASNSLLSSECAGRMNAE